MRKDSIAPGAYQKALELYQFSEKGFHASGVDADDVPVLAPQVSKLKKEDEPWQPNSAFYGNKPVGSRPSSFNYGEEQGTGEYNALDRQLEVLMDKQEELGGRLRRARQLGNFQQEHVIVQERNDVMKAISAVEAQMAAHDMGRFQREMNNGMMYAAQNNQDKENPFRDYAEAIEENDAKIAALQEALVAFAEKKEFKSPGGDSAADPGQSYTRDDDEEDDDEEDDDAEEDEIGAA